MNERAEKALRELMKVEENKTCFDCQEKVVTFCQRSPYHVLFISAQITL